MHKITIDGKTQNLAEWCLKLGLSYKMVCCRIHRGKWSIEQALGIVPPPQKKQKPTIDRIIDNLRRNPETFCWEWLKSLTPGGYGHIWIDGKCQKVHRVMYKYIYGDIPADKPHILHQCDNPKCCNPTHLYAGTAQNNMDDMMNRGRSLKGEKQHLSKLTEKQVLEIRTSEEPQTVLVKRFNVGKATISKIKNRKTWKHI